MKIRGISWLSRANSDLYSAQKKQRQRPIDPINKCVNKQSRFLRDILSFGACQKSKEKRALGDVCYAYTFKKEHPSTPLTRTDTVVE